MSDQHEPGEDTAASEDTAVKQVVSREAGAATLRRLADGVAAGEVTLTGDDAATVSVPDSFEFALGYNAADNRAELAVEAEWPLVDGEPAGVDDSDDGHEAGSNTDAVEAEDSAVDDGVGVEAPASKATFELYRDRATEWRWRLVHDNGNIIADSGEGYSRKATARKGLESVMRNAAGASVVDTSD